MKQLFSKFMAMPIPGKAVLCMVLSGGIFGILYVAGYPQIAYYVGIALIVLTFVLSAFAMMMQGKDKKKAKEVEDSLAENAASSGGVSKVEDRAKLDGMRRQFETGIQTFKDYGKDLYSMPWYVVVGEPGSGKTEAIRHSGIGFPPGLQDQLQGTGGTVNMNWWFTDRSVLLDTAGRLMFEDVAPGENNEWREFLKLLRMSRQNCPINGMLLVIPADTLITDTADEIQSKAGKIAQQFDQIQRSLGVRFPVFVVVTKSDLINGFREFFDDITDPVLTSQMLGWSNPEGLDEPFRPDRVEEHLEEVRGRLLERRFALLQDPVHTTDPRGRRMDQVDALYKFPEAMTELGSRLKLYLEMIFVSGEWSQKPLFLRGIYFTSSMREGDALDAALAETLGVNVKSLPEGKMWTTNRAYFLKDVFLEKVFKESRLVTRAANAGQVKRKRSMLLAGGGLAAALVIAGTLWLSHRETESRITSPLKLWAGVQGWGNYTVFGQRGASPGTLSPEFVRRWMGVYSFAEPSDNTSPPPSFVGTRTIGDAEDDLDFGGLPLTRASVYGQAKTFYEENSSATGLYSLISAIDKDVFGMQLQVQRMMFDRLVFEPALYVARNWMVGEGDRYDDREIVWDGDSAATASLAGLISVEVDRVLGRGAPAEGFDAERFGTMLRFAAGGDLAAGGAAGEDGAAPGLDAKTLESVEALSAYFDWLYLGEGARDGDWPPSAGTGLVVEDEPAVSPLDALERGVGRFVTSLKNPGDAGTLFGQLKAFSDHAQTLGRYESTLVDLRLSFENADDTESYGAAKRAWATAFSAYADQVEVVDAAYGKVSSRFHSEGFRDPKGLREDAFLSIIESSQLAYKELLDAFGGEEALAELEKRAEADDDAGEAARLKQLHVSLGFELDALEEQYGSDVDELIATMSDGSFIERYVRMHERDSLAAYQLRLGVYTAADESLDADRAPEGAGNPLGHLKTIADELGLAIRGINGLVPNSEKDNQDAVGPTEQAFSVSEAAMRAASRHRVYGLLKAEIAGLQGFDARLDRYGAPEFPDIPFTSLAELETPEYGRYTIDANEDLFNAYAVVSGVLNPEDASEPVGALNRGELEGDLTAVFGEIEQHVDDYIDFWSRRVMARSYLPAPNQPGVTWDSFQTALQDHIFEDNVEMVAEQIRGALGLVSEFMDAESDALTLHTRAVGEDSTRSSEGGLEEKIAIVIQNWGEGLEYNPSEAKDKLLRVTSSGRFKRTYMPFGFPSDKLPLGPEGQFYRELTMLGLNVLQRQTQGDVQGDIQTAKSGCAKFPVTLDGQGRGTLSASEIKGLRAVLERVLRQPVAEAGQSDGGNITLINDPEVYDLLKSLSGETLLTPKDKDNLGRAKVIVDYLNERSPFGTSIAALGANYPDNQRSNLKDFRLVSNGVPVIAQGISNDEGWAVIAERRGLNMRFMTPVDQRVRFEFKIRATDPDTWQSTVSGYEPLAALAQAQSQDVGQKRAWPYTMTLSKVGEGQSETYTIGFEFADEGLVRLVERDEWPRSADW